MTNYSEDVVSQAAADLQPHELGSKEVQLIREAKRQHPYPTRVEQDRLGDAGYIEALEEIDQARRDYVQRKLKNRD